MGNTRIPSVINTTFYFERYKKSLEQSRTEYKVLEEKVQDDGSIVIKVIKQYNNSLVGDYLK